MQFFRTAKKNTAHERGVFTAGFTIIEMTIAVGIFSVIMVIVVTALTAMGDASRKARAARAAIDNLSAAMDSIARTVRVSTTFHCGCAAPFDVEVACPYPASAQCFAVEPPGGNPNSGADQTVYRLNNGSIERSVDSGTTYIPLTAPEIRIDRLNFYVDSVVPGLDQPHVTIQITGTASTSVKAFTTFNLQTTISERTPNIIIP